RQRGRGRARAVRRRVQRDAGAPRAGGAGGGGKELKPTIVSREEMMHRFATEMFAATMAAVLWSTPLLAKECYAPDARAQGRACSRAVTTEGGKVIWLGGQTGLPTASFDDQVHQIFNELEKTIKAVCGSGLKDITTMTVFITDPRLGDRLTQIRKEIFK